MLLHVLNGSATEARSLALPGHTFNVIALDGNQVANPAPVPVLWLGATAVAAFLLFYGQRWPAEQTLHRFAVFLDILRPWCT